MNMEIIGAESMGVRSLCCLVTLPDRRIVIDPGVALGYVRHGLLPHPFHGDHVPLVGANPYQLSFQALPSCFRELHCWSKSDDGLSSVMSKRFQDLAGLMGANLQIAEGRSEGPLSFSRAVPHGAPDSNMGTLMMTRIEMDSQVFVHAATR